MEREMLIKRHFLKKSVIRTSYKKSLFIIECNSGGYANFNADHQHLQCQTGNLAEADADLQHQRSKEHLSKADDSLQNCIENILVSQVFKGITVFIV